MSHTSGPRAKISFLLIQRLLPHPLHFHITIINLCSERYPWMSTAARCRALIVSEVPGSAMRVHGRPNGHAARWGRLWIHIADHLLHPYSAGGTRRAARLYLLPAQIDTLRCQCGASTPTLRGRVSIYQAHTSLPEPRQA